MVTRYVFCEFEKRNISNITKINFRSRKFTNHYLWLCNVLFLTFLSVKCRDLTSSQVMAPTGFEKLIFVTITFHINWTLTSVSHTHAHGSSVFTSQRTQHNTNTNNTAHCTSLSGYILHVQGLNKPSGCFKLNLLHIKWLAKCGRKPQNSQKLPPLLPPQ
jgi:hypothetical protein